MTDSRGTQWPNQGGGVQGNGGPTGPQFPPPQGGAPNGDKPLWKKGWFWIVVSAALVVVLIVVSVAVGISRLNTLEDKTDDVQPAPTSQMPQPTQATTGYDEPTTSSTSASSPTLTAPRTQGTNNDREEALAKAEDILKEIPLSQQHLYEELMTDRGFGAYTEEAAKYAVENVDVDWNEMALRAAKELSEEWNMPDDVIADTLTSENGKQFTQEQADYAMEHLHD